MQIISMETGLYYNLLQKVSSIYQHFLVTKIDEKIFLYFRIR